MGLAVCGAINSPYDMDTDQADTRTVEFAPIEPTPPPTPAPSVAEACPSCPPTEDVVVAYQEAMFAAKVAFLVGAVTGLVLANFLRQQANNGD